MRIIYIKTESLALKYSNMTKRRARQKRAIGAYIIDLEGKRHSFDSFYWFEQHNLPCVIVNCMKKWKARKEWFPPWDRLKLLIDSTSLIDVAVANENAEFSGANREQQYLSVSFYEFLSLSVLYAQQGVSMYMAQCPILSQTHTKEEKGLCPLLQDIKIPRIVQNKELEINLWMNIHPTKSAFHYDSYLNLLCIVHGQKDLELHPPSSYVRCESLFSESYNHLTSEFKHQGTKISLKPGQILFIPEGWWHKVNSTANTVALSMWWKGIDQGTLHENLGGSLDFYLAKSCIRRLVIQHADLMIERKIKKLGKIEEKVLENIRAGDTEFIFEALESVSPLLILKEIPTPSLKRLLLKIKHRGNLFEFLRSLDDQALYILITKLEEFDYDADSSVYYAELWGGIENAEDIIQYLLTIKKNITMDSFSRVLKHIV
ncbi:unnamed protein product [Blepharisma stoltei]|uniref:JmjC domain-containing protein n=1 Tax=Blepharisma stoltei TaxID=1481888 RepID=A0AAU9IC73_9CILI|nr:unnamed protein product [Blepharisma stoltei]